MVQYTGTEGIKLSKALDMKYTAMSMEVFKLNMLRVQLASGISTSDEF